MRTPGLFISVGHKKKEGKQSLKTLGSQNKKKKSKKEGKK
jgi:hypothetical protein